MTSERVIDLRTDFIARPTEKMLEAYRARAMQGVYGLREDPLQLELEAKVARLLGCEDALIFPTCTMANLTAVLLHTRPGDVLVCQDKAHVLTAEAGGAAAIGGVVFRTVPGERVEAPIETWLAQAKPARGPSQANPTLCWIENTHNRLGGAAASPAYCRELAQALREKTDVKLHLDGSRILYAAIVCGVAPAALAEPFDTISISLNKGLGAPIAALLAGPRKTIDRALQLRQRLGGGIRPVSAGCAAALVGLDDWPHLCDDVRRAKTFVERLRRLPHLKFLPAVSNLIFFDVDESAIAAPAIVERCAREGVLINSPAPGRIRVVFARDVNDDDLERAIAVVERAAQNR